MRRGLLALVILAWLPSGQPAEGAVGSATEPTPQERVCVPPGLPPFSRWTGGAHATTIIVEDEWGRPHVAVRRLYTIAGQAAQTFWVGGVLVTVDPALDDPQESGWHDRGMVTEATKLRAAPTSACNWFKPPRESQTHTRRPG